MIGIYKDSNKLKIACKCNRYSTELRNISNECIVMLSRIKKGFYK